MEVGHRYVFVGDETVGGGILVGKGEGVLVDERRHDVLLGVGFVDSLEGERADKVHV